MGCHAAVTALSPPSQHVRVVQHVVGQAVLCLVERGGAHRKAGLSAQVIRKSAMDAPRVDRGNLGICLLVTAFVPYGHTDVACGWIRHGFSPAFIAPTRSIRKGASRFCVCAGWLTMFLDLRSHNMIHR